jgi:serine/threonine-protein kinase RsbW
MAADPFPHHSRRVGASAGRRFARGAITDDAHPAREASGRNSDLSLSVPARAENVAVVRHVLDALADALHLPEAVAGDMRLAVTEACTNVVRHAYGGRPGSIDVRVRTTDEALEVSVIDAGRGMGPSSDQAGPGFGLPLIATLADTIDVGAGPGSGSRVMMSFLRDRASSAMRTA